MNLTGINQLCVTEITYIYPPVSSGRIGFLHKKQSRSTRKRVRTYRNRIGRRRLTKLIANRKIDAQFACSTVKSAHGWPPANVMVFADPCRCQCWCNSGEDESDT
jgi:hypothetical protein